MNCPVCGAEDMQPDEISVGMCYDCGRHELEKKELRDRIKCLESENAKLREVVEKLYNQSGLMGWLAMHSDGLDDELAEAARGATP